MAKSEKIADNTANEQEITEATEKPSKGSKKQNAELETLTAELEESKDKYLRLYSEFENFRRRTSKEKLDLIGSANENLLQSLITVLDDFERAEKSMTDTTDVKSVKEGVELVYNKFKSVLEQKGLKKMEAEKGIDFDVERHEAITQIPAPEESLKGKVVDVVENGYLLNDKVIRFAKVVTGA